MSSWPVVRIVDIAVSRGLVGGPFGSNLGGKDYVTDGVPVIRGGNLASGLKFKNEDFVFVSREKVDRDLSRNLAEPGDVVFTQRGTLGQVGIVPKGPYDKYVISQSQMRLRVDPAIALPEYVYYCARSPKVVKEIHDRAITTGVPHINLGILGSLEISLPPLAVQEGIVSMLSALDAKIASNERLSRTVRELVACYFKDAKQRSTRTVPLGDIADVFDGPHATPKKTSEGAWFLSISSLNKGHLVLGHSACVSEEDYRRWTRRVAPRSGDVLFSYETRLGEAALMPSGIRACLGRRMALLRPRTGRVGPQTLLCAFLADEFQETIQRRAVRGATVDRIPLKDLPTWPIEVPSEHDAARFEKLAAALYDVAVSKDRERDLLERARDTLLPKLMSGEVTMREAVRNDS